MQIPRFVLLRQLLAACLLFVAALVQTAAADTSDWQLDTPEHRLQGTTLLETVWSQSRPPGGVWDRIRVHRYRGEGTPFAALLYLPGTHMNGATTQRDETYQLWLYLAARGVEVFTLDYRTHAIPASTDPLELGALQTWDTALFVGDTRAAAEWVRHQSRQSVLYLAGFSRGAFLAYAHALQQSDGLTGLVVLDGAFKSPAPNDQYDAKTALSHLRASGRWASDVGGSRGWRARQQLMHAVMADPSAPAPNGEHASVGDLLTHVLHTAWGEGGLARKGVSAPRVLATLLAGYDRYYPAIQEIESRAVANHMDAPDSLLDDRWGQLRLPLLVFASTGMGEAWTQSVLHSAHTSGSHNVETRVLEGYGHLDVLVGKRAVLDVYQPLFDWLCACSHNCRPSHARLQSPPASHPGRWSHAAGGGKWPEPGAHPAIAARAEGPQDDAHTP